MLEVHDTTRCLSKMSFEGIALQPTFQGYVSTTRDALILFEACLQGYLSHIPRRPQEWEWKFLIRSGSVFIYGENVSGIQVWRDGVAWSPSRIMGSFNVYHELNPPLHPGDQSDASLEPTRKPCLPYRPYSGTSGNTDGTSNGDGPSYQVERSIGSLANKCACQKNGLVKMMMSITIRGVKHYLVAYHCVTDIVSGRLQPPSEAESLESISLRPELSSRLKFRTPHEELEQVGEKGPDMPLVADYCRE